MKLLAINPNTTDSMTQTIGRSARAVAGPDTEIVAVSSPTGPAAIESHYDEALAVPGLLAAIRAHPADAYILACFGDPGLDAAREIAPGPVVGIAEAAMRTATYLTRSFSIVTTLARTTGRAQELVGSQSGPAGGPESSFRLASGRTGVRSHAGRCSLRPHRDRPRVLRHRVRRPAGWR